MGPQVEQRNETFASRLSLLRDVSWMVAAVLATAVGLAVAYLHFFA